VARPAHAQRARTGIGQTYTCVRGRAMCTKRCSGARGRAGLGAAGCATGRTHGSTRRCGAEDTQPRHRAPPPAHDVDTSDTGLTHSPEPAFTYRKGELKAATCNFCDIPHKRPPQRGLLHARAYSMAPGAAVFGVRGGGWCSKPAHCHSRSPGAALGATGRLSS
jgi:hypothetical protein